MSKRILFVLASPEYLRYFDTTMALLAERGHTVMVGVNWLREQKHARLDALIADPRIEVVGQVPSREDAWVHMARAIRGSFDFLRYLHPSLADATALRTRARIKAAPSLVRVFDRIERLEPAALERVYAVLRLAESAVPVSRRVVDFLEAQRPDLVVVSPLVDLMGSQVDMVRAAQSLGIPVALSVASWDNLTNKGHLRVVPDLVAVWNERQKEEAVDLHGIPRERVAVTGAQLFDRWFERQPSQPRAAYCAMVGLPSDEPFILYTGSSIFIARSEFEVPHVRKWLSALRTASAPGLRAINVVIRPHPFNSAAWEQADFSDLGPVTIWPRARYTPASEVSRDAFFDSLYYCNAVVGINTSAMIEAAILGKPVLSLLTPEFAGTQEGTLHFRYLLPENGGFLRVASSVEQHLAQLAEVTTHQDAARAELTRFVGSFLRPGGLDHACTPQLARTLEAAAAPVAPRRERWNAVLARLVLLPFAWTMVMLWAPITREGRDAGWRFSHLRLGDRLRKAGFHPVRWMRMVRTRPVRRARKHLFERPRRVLVRGYRYVLSLLARAKRFVVRSSRLVLSRLTGRERTPHHDPVDPALRDTLATSDGSDKR